MKFTNKALVPVLLLVIAAILIVILRLSTGVSGETDSILHYQISRYAFKYPKFFLDLWGKPLFTILSSPLSQFGYMGAVTFNLVCGLLSAWFASLIAKRMEYRYAWVAILFTVFTPIYLFIMYTSLTEILFSLVLIASIYLFISRRFIWSAILISFIMFVRTEGMMFIVLFIVPLVWMKQYKSLPFLFVGLITLTLASWPVYHDPLWFINKLPYSSSGSELYGHGSFWYYFGQMDYILSYPLLILSITGFLFIILNLKKGFSNLKDIKYVTLYFLIIPSIFGFILAQSFLWWKGWMAVLASTRFIACVLPLVAIISLTGFEWIMEKAKANKIVFVVFGSFVLSLVVYKPFTYHVVPMKTGINFAVMEQLTGWLKSTAYSTRKAFYTDPTYPFYMDIDPWDQQKCFKIYSYENTDPASLLRSGELLIWDAQFAGYEGHLPFDSLMKNNNLRLLNVFTPLEAFTIIGGEKYKLAVFMKAPRDTTKSVFKQFYFNDYEGSMEADQMKHITTGFSNSGKQSIEMTPDNIYSPTYEGKLMSLPGNSNISIRASVRVLNPSASEKGQIILVMSTEDPEYKIYKYFISKDLDLNYKPGEWFTLTLTDVFEHNVPANGNLKVYVWYTGKNKIYIDDLKLEYMPVGFE